MTRSKFIPIYITALLIFSVLVFGFGSWLIIPTMSASATHPTVNPEDIDTSPCFETEFTFSGAALTAEDIALNSAGIEVYGSDLDYSVSWVGGKLVDGRNLSTFSAAYQGVVAGTHYYKITDNTTGQTICNYHEVVISPDKFETTAAVTTPSPVFEGAAVNWTVTLTGVNSGIAYTFTHTLAQVPVDSYSYDSTTGLMVSSKSLTESVLGNTAVSDGSYNNYPLPSIVTTNYSGVNSNNFDSSSANFSYTLGYDILPTCYNGSGTTVTAYYGNLTKAIESSTSGTIYAMQSFTYNDTTYTATAGKAGNYAHTITRSCTIPSGVTLTIPYGTSVDTVKTLTNGNIASAYGSTTYNKNCVTVNGGVTLTNKGTINIAGIVSGGGGGYSNNSITAKDHSRIIMAGSTDSPSKIDNTGTITCYGFIAESSLNNGSEVIMNGGTLTTVFTVTEHRGGDIYMGMVNPTVSGLMSGMGSGVYSPTLTCFPFNRFYIMSVTSKLTVTSSGQIDGYVDMYADGQPNETTMKLIGSGSSNLLQVASGTKIVAKFDPSTLVHDLDVYGSLNVNSLALGLSVTKSGLTVNIELSSAGAFFPLSYHWDINFKKFENGANATVTSTTQDVKILPGASLIVDDGVTMSATNIAVYADNTLLNPSGRVAAASYSNNTPGSLIVNGALNVTNLGGKVITQNSNATLNISGGNSVISYELSDSAATSLEVMGVGVDYSRSIFSSTEASKLVANGPITADFVTATNGNLKASEHYVMTVGDSNLVWRSETQATVKFNLQNENATIASPTQTVDISSSGMVNAVSTLLKPAAKGYAFLGWYTDAECTTAVTQAYVNSNNTLINVYAGWEMSDVITIDVDIDGVVTQVAANLESANTVLPGKTDYCDDISNARYAKTWTFTITDSSGTEIKTVQYDGGTDQTYLLKDLIGDGYSYEAALDYSYTLTANMANKHKISTTVGSGLGEYDATITVNGKEYDGSVTSPIYVKSYDTVKVYAYGKGTGSIISWNACKVEVTSNGENVEDPKTDSKWSRGVSITADPVTPNDDAETIIKITLT